MDKLDHPNLESEDVVEDDSQDDIYYDDFREEMLENDEISIEEEAFMRGYVET